MAGGNVAAGLALLLAVTAVTLLVAFIQTEGSDTTGNGFAGCDFEDNECDNIGIDDFIAAIVDVTITGIDGAPLIVNALYLLATGGAWIAGVILIVVGALSAPLGGG